MMPTVSKRRNLVPGRSASEGGRADPFSRLKQQFSFQEFQVPLHRRPLRQALSYSDACNVHSCVTLAPSLVTSMVYLPGATYWGLNAS